MWTDGEWLREFNVVHSKKELFVCSLYLTPSDYYFPGRYIKARLITDGVSPGEL